MLGCAARLSVYGAYGSSPWFCTMALWHHGTAALCSVPAWLCTLWHYGTTALWLRACMALLLFGAVPGNATPLAVPLGFMPVWLHSSVIDCS